MRHTHWAGPGMIFVLAVSLSACASHQETADSGDFGGQPKDQAARERHHPQYPESAQHLGPQDDQSAQGDTTNRSSEQTEQERAAVSGVGK